MKKILGLLILACVTTPVFSADSPPSRLLNGINWIDFRQWVPEKIDTVLARNPDSDPSRAQEFYSEVLQRLQELIRTTITKWNQAGL